MTTLRNDLRYAARLLIKSPAFTVVAVATLAIGIGANAAIFSVVDAALLNPLPYPTPDRLVAVWETLQRDTVERREFSYPDYRDLRDRTMSFDAIAAWAPETLTMSTPEAPARQVSGDLASAAYFELLGVTPIAGRIYTKTEDAERDAHPVSLVSYAFWQRELGGVPAVGRGIVLNDRAFTIIGVLPKGFRGLNDNSDVWIPMGMLGVAESSYEQRGARWHQVVARLKDGVSLQQANADVTSIARQLGQAYPSKVSYGAAVFSLQQEIVGRVEPLLLTLLAAVGLVLLLACVNLANLLLARATTRRRETAIRAALGADRRRLVQQFLAEAALLSVVGAGAGLLLALWAVDDIIALAPVGFPSFVNPRLDGGVLLFVIAVSCGVGIVLGLLPAVHGSRADLNDALKEGGRGLSAGAAPARMRSALVVTQVALSLLLLVGAGLMVRTFINVQRVEVGFQPERALTMRVALPQKYSDRLPQAAAALLAQISAVSGVQQAAIGTDAPFTEDASATYAMPEGATAGVGDRGIRVYRHGISPGFFSALGAGLVNGRDFDTHDATDAPPVAIVSRRIASKAWPGLDPIGRRFTIGRGTPITIVGIAPDLRYRSLIADASRNPDDPDVYWPYAQRPERTLSLVVRTAGKPAALITAVRDAVHTFDRDAPTYAERPFSKLIGTRLARFRLAAAVMSCFGLVALFLAGIGVYGQINYSVMQRRQEMGVRLALGAGRREIYGLVLKDAWRLTLAGIAIGVTVVLPSARLLGTLLYGVTPNDPVTYASITALLLTVALTAALLPARRAARADPMVALRTE